MTAFSSRLASRRTIAASSSSVADISPEATNAACATASRSAGAKASVASMGTDHSAPSCAWQLETVQLGVETQPALGDRLLGGAVVVGGGDQFGGLGNVDHHDGPHPLA